MEYSATTSARNNTSDDYSLVKAINWQDYVFPRLISLAEIMFTVYWLCKHLDYLTRLDHKATAGWINGKGDNRVADEDGHALQEINHALQFLKIDCMFLGLSASLNQIATFAEKSKWITFSYNEFRHRTEQLRETIDSELKTLNFAYVPIEKNKKLESIKSDWGEIWTKFPNTEFDSREAVQCYALNANTACVFHLMRTVEHGMRALAKALKVKTGKPIAWADWQAIIEAMEVQVKKMSALKTGAAKDAKLTFYSTALLDLRAFKDAFRNHIMHTRKSYDEHEALGILTRVHGFMNHIASGKE